MLNRRKFIAVGGSALASLGIPFSTLAAASPHPSLHSGVDAKHGNECGIYCDGQLVARMDLVEINTPFPEESKVTQYILNFEAKDPVHLQEASYQISHPVFGHLDLFLQPCGALVREKHDGIHYRSYISMLR